MGRRRDRDGGVDLRAELKSFEVLGHFVGRWWREPVDYTAQVQYFTKRSLAGAIKVLIGFGTGVVAVISLSVLVPTTAAPHALTSTLIVATFAAVTLFWAIVWCCRPWPSRRVSAAFVITSDIGIATVTIHHATWLTGMFGLNALALISVYLMYFGGPKALVLHSAGIAVVATGFAVAVAAGDPDLAVKILAAVVPLIATPVGVQFGIWTLRNDANESVSDPLTGLLNRRGLNLHFDELLCDGLTKATHLAAMVVDLDRFKTINDTFGHATGDAVLIHCARQIKSVIRGSALVARIGGEEFVVVDRCTDPHLGKRLADRIRYAIAAPVDHVTVTASIGVTSASLADHTAGGAAPVALLDTLIARADQAMFDAKREGGNTIKCVS